MTTQPRLYILILIALTATILLAGCGGSNRFTPPASDVISAQSTAIYSGAASQVAIAQATYTAEQSSIRATAEYQATDAAINATISAHDVGYLPTRAAIQATIDAARAGEAQARLDAANANLQIAKRTAADTITLSQLQVISQTNAVTTTAALRQREVDRANDWMFSLPDLAGRWIPIIFGGVLLFCLIWIVRAVAARISGDSDRAMLVLGYPSHMKLLPSPAGYDNDEGETLETPHTGNTGNTQNNTGNTVSSVVFPYYNHDRLEYRPQLTNEERTAIYKAKDSAIRILQAAADYNAANPGGDPALIARYDALGVKAEDRGEVCGMLEALIPAAVSIKKGGKGQGTFVTPDYGASVANLLLLIKSNDVRLYPPGFRSDAVNAAEILNREINSISGVTR